MWSRKYNMQHSSLFVAINFCRIMWLLYNLFYIKLLLCCKVSDICPEKHNLCCIKAWKLEKMTLTVLLSLNQFNNENYIWMSSLRSILMIDLSFGRSQRDELNADLNRFKNEEYETSGYINIFKIRKNFTRSLLSPIGV